MKTLSIKKSQIERSWFIVDASGKKLGRLASNIAQIIRGKHKPLYTPNIDMGDFVIVINADKVIISGNKSDQKEYWRHTGFPGGQKVTSYKSLKENNPEKIISTAVKGMLPHNRLGRKLFSHLKVYAGTSHPHTSQKPEVLEINE